MSNSKEVAKASLYWFRVEDIEAVTDPEHRLYDPRIKLPPDPGLVESIKLNGVKEPLKIIREATGTYAGKLVICNGRRRYRAAVEACKQLRAEGTDPEFLPRLPCWYAKAEDGTASMVIANEHRLEETPLEKARKAAAMIARGVPESEIRKLFGVTSTTIKGWLQLLNAPPEALAALERGETTATDTRKRANGRTRPARAPRERLQWSVKQMREWVASRVDDAGMPINGLGANVELAVGILAHVSGLDPEAKALKGWTDVKRTLKKEISK